MLQLAVQVILHTLFVLTIMAAGPLRDRSANFKYLTSEIIRAFAIFLTALQAHASANGVQGVAGMSVRASAPQPSRTCVWPLTDSP